MGSALALILCTSEHQTPLAINKLISTATAKQTTSSSVMNLNGRPNATDGAVGKGKRDKLQAYWTVSSTALVRSMGIVQEGALRLFMGSHI